MSNNYIFKGPNGNIVKIKNLKKFCEENNLDVCHMYKLAKGKRSNHKGWTNPNESLKFLVLESKNGEKIKLLLHHNAISSFCEGRGLDTTHLYHKFYDKKWNNDWRVIERG